MRQIIVSRLVGGNSINMRLVTLISLIVFLQSCGEFPISGEGDAVPQGDIEVTAINTLETSETIKLKTAKGEDELIASTNPAEDSLVLYLEAQEELIMTWEGVIVNPLEQFNYGFIEWRGETQFLFGNSFAGNRTGLRMHLLLQGDSLSVSFSD